MLILVLAAPVAVACVPLGDPADPDSWSDGRVASTAWAVMRA